MADPKLQPVDHDPFAESAEGPAFVPVDGDPFADEPGLSVTPVDNDPFDGEQPIDDSWMEVGRKVIANTPAMLKQSGAGLLQQATERPISTFAPVMPDTPIAAGVALFEDALNRGGDWLREKFGMEPDKGAEWAAKVYADAAADLQENAPNVDPDSLKGYAYDAATSLIQMMPSVAATIVTKKPIVGAGITGAQVGGQQYGESRAEGRTPQQAAQDAGFMAIAEGVPEMLPLGVLMKPGKKFFGRVFSTAGAEGISEVATSILQTGYDAGVLKEDMTWGEAVDAVQRAGIIGAVTGGGAGAIAHPFVRDRGAGSTSPNVAPDAPAAETRPPGPPPTSQDSGAATIPPAEAPPTRLGPWSPPPMVRDATVGLKNKDGPPVRATIEAIQDGWVFWRDEDGNQQADREVEFRRDLTTPPPARRGDLGVQAEPSGRPTPPPVETGDMNDFDPFAIQEPKPRTPTIESPQRSLQLSDTEQIKRLRERAQANLTLMAEAQRIGQRTPQEIASYRVEAAKLMEEAAELERAISARGDRQDPTGATPEQMAARGLGPLAQRPPAASEATTGPQQFEVTPPKAPPAGAQGALAPVAGSEAENPQAPQFQPKAPEVPWQQRLRQRIATKSARVNDPELLAKQLGVTPQDVSSELTKIAGTGPKAPIRLVRGTISVDKKTGKVERSKYAGRFQYAPKPSETAVEDLADFVLAMGGIRPTGSFAGELAARDLDKVNIPFKGKIVNPNGRMTFEQMAQAAMEAGFTIPTEAGTVFGQEEGLQAVGATSPSLDKFMEMLDQNANKVRRHFRMGEEPVAAEDRPATPAARKSAALARLAELGFEPKGKTVEELEQQLDDYESAIGDFEPIDRLDLQRAMEMENVDRLGDEARNAVKEETGGDFPYEYDAEWFAAETAGSSPATLDEASAGAAAREGATGTQPDSESAAGQGDQGADAPAADAEQATGESTQTSRVDDGFGGEDSTDNQTDDLKAHLAAGGTTATWVTENGKRTGNEYAAITVGVTPRFGMTSNNPAAVTWPCPPEMATPGENVTLVHNHPLQDGLSVALSAADLQPLTFPGFTFSTAVSHSNDVSGAALTEAGENWIMSESLTDDQASEAISRLYGQAHSLARAMEPNSLKAQDLAMRILAHAGLVEYHTTIPMRPMLQPAIEAAGRLVQKRMVENGFEAPTAAQAHDAHRPTVHKGGDVALAAISRRSQEVAARRAGHAISDVGGSSGDSQTSATRTARVSDRTDQGEQLVLPGAERSDKQALAARAAKPLLKSDKPQKPAGGLFAEPTGVIAKLFADESGTLTLPEWETIKKFVTKLRGKKPSTPADIAREGLKIPVGDPNTLQALGYPAQQTRTAVSLASIDRPSAIYWNALLRRDHVKTTLEREAVKAVQPYLALDVKQRDRINKVLEYDRLFGIDRTDTGRTVVVKVPDKRPPFGERPELSKPGEIIALDLTETTALHGLRKFFDKRLLQIGEAAAIERGYKGAFNKKAIQAEIDGAGNPMLRKIAQSAMDVWEQTEEMRRTGYVPFQRYGDTFILIKPKAPDSGIMEPEGERAQAAWFELVDTKSAFDKVFSRPGGKNSKPLDERVAELQKRFPPDKFDYDIRQATPKAVADLNIPALEKALASLNLKKDAQSKKIIDEIMTQIFQARKAGLRKQANNVPGYSTDFERSIADYVRQSSSIVSHLATRRDVDSGYDTVQKHPTKEVRDYWEQHQHHMEKEGGDWAPVRKYGFFMFLWGNPASAMVNLTQTPLVTQFQLGTWAGLRAPGLAHHAMMQALGAVRPTKEGLAIDFDVLAGMLTEPEMAMIRTLQAEGRLDPVLSNEFRGFDRGRTKVRPHMTVLSRIYEIGASGFNTTETVNRIAAALAYFRAAQNQQLREKAAKVYAKDQNWQEMVGRFPQPIDIARFGVDETQFIGGKLNRMPAMRGMGGAILQFKTYIANYIRIMHKNFTRMGPQGKAAGAMMLIALLMASGLAGLPFADDLLGAYDGTYKLVTGIDSNLEYQFRNWLDDAGFGEYAAEIMTRGLGRDAFGVDIGGRLGMGNLFPDNSFTSIAPVLTGSIGNIANAVDRYNTGQTAGAAADLAPMFAGSGVGNLIRALIQYPTEGASTRKGNWLVMPEDITTADMATKAIGFQPTKMTRAGERQYMAGRIANATKEARNAMITNLAREIILEEKARAKGDKAAADKHQARIDAIFAKNVAQLVDPSIEDWQKIKPASRIGLKRRVQSLLAPDIARLKRSSKLSREELSDLPFVDE